MERPALVDVDFAARCCRGVLSRGRSAASEVPSLGESDMAAPVRRPSPSVIPAAGLLEYGNSL